MNKFYKHKESGMAVRPVDAGEGYVDVILACEVKARLAMTSTEFDEQFELCRTQEVDLEHTTLGPSELGLYFMEYTPVFFEGDDRLLKIVVPYDKIIKAFYHLAVDEDGNPVKMKEI